ncbi:MAG TPA: FAD-dependent oxidoreductase [Thermoanaerobaculia bacterium]|nr:FAD-dependent oxidoreductase [Thermoanaerobaculia bacterium]
MSRTPLFDSLRRALRLAAIAARQRPDVPPIDELISMPRTRRRFMRDSALATAGLVVACQRRPAETPVIAMPERPGNAGATRIAIVGGGMAGLNTAWKLKKAGLEAKIFEGADRTGGRIFTASNLLGDGLTTELGGEFIDSTHEEMLALMDEFSLERLDTLGAGAADLTPETYFINGRHYTQADAAREFVPLAKQILEHYDSMGEVVDYENEGGGGVFDRMSIAQYFDRIGASGWLRELLEVAYVTEYGLDAGEQSALNFIFLIGTGDLADAETCSLLGESDERYKVRGGNQRIVDELAERLKPQIHRRHRLEAIRSRGDGYTLTFQTSGGTIDEVAEVVVLAIPFTLLRDVKMDVELPDLKRRAIQELGYGANAKVLVGFRSRPWQKLGYSGATYSDEMFQLAWDNSFLQPGTAGGLTLYSGGKLALAAGEGTAEEAAARLMRGIERAYPGATRERNGKVSRFHWPTFPWTLASYSCYKPGQWTTIAGVEGLPVGNLFFAGEHCSYDFQGYMNGAAQSGADTAKAVMAMLSGSELRKTA